MSVLKRGMKGTRVQSWQRMINASKIMLPIGTDGIFGPETAAATVKMQEYLGVTADGVVGSTTLDAYAGRFPEVRITVDVPDTATRTAAPELHEVTGKTGITGKTWILILAALAGIFFATRGGR